MKKRRALLFVMLVSLSPLLTAQAPTGFPRFASMQSAGFDTINQGDLNVNFSIPIVSKPGRGLAFSPMLSYNGLIWVNLGYAWAPAVDQNGSPNWGWGRQSPVGQAKFTRTRYRCVANDETNQWTLRYNGYSFVDPSGTTRSFSLDIWVAEQPELYPECGDGPGPYSAYSTDGSGYLLDVPYVSGYSQNAQVYAPTGANVDFSGPSQDTNGNSIGSSYVNSSETDWIDTLGQTSLKIINNSGNTQYEYRDTSGAWQPVTMTLTSFKCEPTSAVPE
jgi:hypothetical protein